MTTTIDCLRAIVSKQGLKLSKTTHPDSNGIPYFDVWKIILNIVLNENNSYMSNISIFRNWKGNKLFIYFIKELEYKTKPLMKCVR